MHFLKIVFLLLNFFVCNLLNAQSTPIGKEEKRAVESIQAIKEGTMVVILATNAKKINSMVKTLRAKNLKPNLKKRLKDQLFDIVIKTERQNKYLIEYFNKHYTFSDLRFMYDTAMVHLRAGTDIFIGDDLYINEAIELALPIGGFIRIGRANNQGTGVLALLVCDDKNKVLDTPFPYNMVLPDGDSLESERAFFEQVIERTSLRIEDFYKEQITESNRKKLYKN